MISMKMMGKIRRMYFRDKLSLHQIAKRTGLSRNTIREWVRAPEATQPAYLRCAAFNKFSPFHERIWLDAQDYMFHTFEELNVWLGQRCRALWSELLHPQYNGLTVADVLELERVEMMPMPTAFDGYVECTVRVSSTCLISVVRNRKSSQA